MSNEKVMIVHLKGGLIKKTELSRPDYTIKNESIFS